MTEKNAEIGKISLKHFALVLALLLAGYLLVFAIGSIPVKSVNVTSAAGTGNTADWDVFVRQYPSQVAYCNSHQLSSADAICNTLYLSGVDGEIISQMKADQSDKGAAAKLTAKCQNLSGADREYLDGLLKSEAEKTAQK